MQNNFEENQPWYYSISYFFIANQVVLRRLAVVLLILINILIWWLGGVKLVNYLSDTKKFNITLNQLSQPNINWQNIHSTNRPQELKILSVDKVARNKNTYDLFAEVHNPNADWHIKDLNYYFVIDDFVSDEQNTFVLPQQTKYIFKFSFKSTTPPKNISFKTKSLAWQKIKEDDKLNLLDNLIISDKKINNQDQTTTLKFNVYNNTPYSWWTSGWQILLSQGSRPVAAHYVTYHSFLAGEEKTLSASWDKTISANQIKIIPDINLHDAHNYITDLDAPPVNLIKGVKTFRSHE